jgi:hypothetical protein
MKRPCILYGEQTYNPLQRQAFPVNTDFEAPRDMEVEAVWMGATGPLRTANAEVDVDLNFKVKNRPDVVQGDLMPMRMFDTAKPDRALGWSQNGWLWCLRYPYRMKSDGGMGVYCLNQIPVAGGVVNDRFGFAAHAVEVGASGMGQRELMLFDTILRAAVAAQKMAQPQRTAQPDGKIDLDVISVSAMRGDWSLWPSLVASIPRPRQFYVKVAPVGREQWSEILVPLPAYGLTAHPWESGGVFWQPQGSLILPKGYSFNFDVRNNNAGRARLVQIAILGYVEEE